MTTLTSKTIPTVYKQALGLQASGDLSAAKNLYNQINDVRPNLAEVHYQLARIHIKESNFVAAFEAASEAVRLKPNEGAIWKEVLTIAKLDGSLELRRSVLALAENVNARPDVRAQVARALGVSHSNDNTEPDHVAVKVAKDFLKAGNFESARDVATEFLAKNPGHFETLMIIGQASAELGEHDLAVSNFQSALKVRQTSVPARARLGWSLIGTGETEAGAAELLNAVRTDPSLPEPLVYLAKYRFDQGRFDDAATLFVRALQLDPTLDDVRIEAAASFLAERNDQNAIAILEPISHKVTKDARNLILAARAKAGLGETDEALAMFDKAIEAAPQSAQPLMEKGRFVQSFGRFEEAKELHRRAVRLDPTNGAHYRNLVTVEKTSEDDPIIPEMEALWASRDLQPSSRAFLGFALAKVMEDTKQYSRVFNYLKPANDSVSEAFPFDWKAQDRTVREIKAAFADMDTTLPDGKTASDFAPIFVTSLPRSGSTLVEQIIASHSLVKSGGELGFARAHANQVFSTPGNAYRKPADVSDEEFRAIADQTEADMRRRVSDAQFIIDKSVATYGMIGPLKLAMPKSRIVVVRRDPRDNLLSIYKNLFVFGTHRYSTSLTDLARYYHAFVDLIEFWRETTPGWFYELNYEDLVANPEEESRKLIDFCGLEWEDACLDFYKSKQRVETLSLYQVRQPIYTSSTKSWQRYEKELKPLFDALDTGKS